jgi:HD superfamily phosphohydrolase
MTLTDLIFGVVEITEPVILDIINSDELKRLERIDQAGYPPLWAKPAVVKDHYHYSRLAHSIGVFLLLRRFGASIEEQITGLIHDASHSAFSHCIDYILDEGSETEHSHQDNTFYSFVKKSSLPDIFKSYGFDTDFLLDDKNFSLKEKELPDICADRLDYSLRCALFFGEIGTAESDYFLDQLSVQGGNWAFKGQDSAKKFAELFLKLNETYYASLKSAIMFRTVGDTVRYALKMHYISRDDLYTTDGQVLEKIRFHLSHDQDLNRYWRRMNNEVAGKNDPAACGARVLCKSRVVDPYFIHKGVTRKLSDEQPDWQAVVMNGSQPKCYWLKFSD